MKQLIFTLLTLVSVSVFSQTSRSGCETFQYDCCPNVINVTITGAQLDSLHVDSVLLITPGLGKSIRLVKPPVMRVFHDGPTLSFSSGEQIQIVNEFGDDLHYYAPLGAGYGNGLLSSFGDPCVSPFEGGCTGSFWHNPFIPWNGQITPAIPHVCTGSIYALATFPVMGGGSNAKIVLTIWYEEIPHL
jgi:hypothetical protein